MHAPDLDYDLTLMASVCHVLQLSGAVRSAHA